MSTLHTIGHSNVPLEHLLQLLAQHRIECVIDVRSVPFSRYCPQYNRVALADALSKAGIGYRFEGERLGGRIQDPDCYLDKRVPEYKKGFLHRIDYAILVQKPFFAAGLKVVADLAGTQRIALICSEENPDHCHRSLLLTRRLLELGHEVLHIRGDGRLENGTFPLEHGKDQLVTADRTLPGATPSSTEDTTGTDQGDLADTASFGEQLRFL
jgi:uncharacterized protein (DUF488 family)